MTREEWAELSPEAQQIKVATCCGWRRMYTRGEVECWVLKSDERAIGHPKLPDYLNDLNAMHEAEKLLTGTLFVNRLWDVGEYPRNQMAGLNAGIAMDLLNSTAAQRAEAFVLTMEAE